MHFTKTLTDLERTVLRTLWESGGKTRGELLRDLNLSRPTVDKAIRSLQGLGLAICEGRRTPQRGRPAEVFRVHREGWLSLGLDCELPTVDLALTDAWGMPLHEGRFVLNGDLEDARSVLARLVAEAKTWLDGLSVPIDRLAALGVGLPGFLADGGVSLVGQDLPSWRQVPIREHLERQFGVPVFMGHDVHLMAAAEVSRREWADAVVLYVALRPGVRGGIRIGACLCLYGRAYRGGRGNGGALYRAVVEGNELVGRSSEERVACIVERIVASLVHAIPMSDPERIVLHAGLLGEDEPLLIDRCQEAVRSAFAGEYLGVADIVPAAVRGAGGAEQAAVAAIRELLQR